MPPVWREKNRRNLSRPDNIKSRPQSGADYDNRAGGRSETVLFRSRLGTLRLSSVDSPHFSRRLSAQISASTSSHHSSLGLRQIQVAQERDSGIPDQGHVGQGSHRTSKGSHFGRVLQPSLPSTEGLRPVIDLSCLNRHLDIPEGCVFSYTHPSSISEIPTLSGRGRVF